MNRGDRRNDRITVELDDDISKGIKEHVRWGLLKPLINTMLRDFLKLCEDHNAELVVGAIISNEITLKEFLSKEVKKKDEEE